MILEYQEALTYIENIQTDLGSDYSLREVIELSERVGRPERKLKFIHIAGTNGKGSVGNYIAHMLAASGYVVGRYVSPTIFEYRERIQRLFPTDDKNCCEYISQEEVAVCLSQLKTHCEQMRKDGFGQPTAFEIETVMAFMMFASWQVDIVILETGLGGRLDATNIIEHPLQCVFTSISMDHMQILGDTLEKIAQEKYGIIKEGSIVISLEQEKLKDILIENCQKRDVFVSFVNPSDITNKKIEMDCQSFSYKGNSYTVKQAGIYQLENASLAIEAVKALKGQGFKEITLSSMQRGLLLSRWKGRFEILSSQPFLLVDGAHNEEAAKRLRESLEGYFPQERFVFIFGIFRDKEYEKVLAQLLPLAEKIYTVTPPGVRGLESRMLCDIIKHMSLKDKGLTRQVRDCNSVKKALSMALERDAGKRIIVCGTLSILGDVYAFMEEFDILSYSEQK